MVVTYDTSAYFGILCPRCCRGSVVQNINNHLIWSFLLSVAVTLFYELVVTTQINELKPKNATDVAKVPVPWVKDLLYFNDYIWPDSDIISKMTLFVALLVAFRTNISYQRYWEGRGYMGTLMKVSRARGGQRGGGRR